MSLTQLFPPRRDAGLLLLRVATGLSIFFLFGLAKLKAALAFPYTGHWEFVDFNRRIGLPVPVLIAYAQTLNESAGALLVTCGFFTQLAALFLATGFAVATACSIKAQEPTWLLAGYFCVTFATVALTGGGKYSFDAWSRSGRRDQPM